MGQWTVSISRLKICFVFDELWVHVASFHCVCVRELVYVHTGTTSTPCSGKDDSDYCQNISCFINESFAFEPDGERAGLLCGRDITVGLYADETFSQRLEHRGRNGVEKG